MNEQNIKPYEFTSDQSREEAAKNGAKGGIASGKARRERRLIADILRGVLDETISSGETRGDYIVKMAVNDIAVNGELSRLKAVEMIQRVLGERIIKIEASAPTLQVVTNKEGEDAINALLNENHTDGD